MSVTWDSLTREEWKARAEKAEEWLKKLQGETWNLKSENERLRKALSDIASPFVIRITDDYRRIAEQALDASEGKDNQ